MYVCVQKPHFVNRGCGCGLKKIVGICNSNCAIENNPRALVLNHTLGSFLKSCSLGSVVCMMKFVRIVGWANRTVG